jgi:hypothetical protein
MNAALLDLPTETPKTPVSCVNCPAVQRLDRALEELRADFRREVINPADLINFNDFAADARYVASFRLAGPDTGKNRNQ